LAPASLTVFPALFTALYKKLPIDFAPWRALFDTEKKIILNIYLILRKIIVNKKNQSKNIFNTFILF